MQDNLLLHMQHEVCRRNRADAHEDEVVKDAFRRQREVHDLGEVHLVHSLMPQRE
jgi:hypothetical protein